MDTGRFSDASYLLKAKAKLAGKIIKIPGIDAENFPVRNSLLGIVPQGKIFLSDEVAEFLFAVDDASKEVGYEIPFLLFGKNQGQNVIIDNYVSSGISERTEARFSELNSYLQDFISKSKKDGTDVVVHGHSHPKTGSYYTNFSLGDMKAYMQFRKDNPVFDNDKICLISCLITDGNFNFLFYDGNDYYKFNDVYERMPSGEIKRLKCYQSPDVIINRGREYR